MRLNITVVVIRLLALLTITADLLALGGLALLWLTRRGRGPDWAMSLREVVSGYALPLAWVAAVTCTVGSLYYSEVADFVPCKLCWYQRIAMYPLAVILGIAALTRDWGVRRYVLPLTAIGAGISVYHYTLERFPDLAGSACDPSAPCTFLWVWQFHFISIPFQALSGFALIAAALLFRPQAAAGADRPAPAENEIRDDVLA